MNITREQAVELACGIQGWMNRDELFWLFDRAGEVPCGGTWVEVGTWKGRSALATALGLSAGSRLVCVDNFLGNPESEAHWESQLPCNGDNSWLRACWLLARRMACTLNRGVTVALDTRDSVAAASSFAAESVDAVFIDASHEEGKVAADIRAWLRPLKFSGLLCGHDLCPDRPGVEAAVRSVLGWERCRMALRSDIAAAGGPVSDDRAIGTMWWTRKT